MRCESGHSYDIARSGYVNLHRPGIKSNARSGDPEDMVAARRAFLARGYYDRYVWEAAALALDLADGRLEMLTDAACGEGHHTLTLAKALSPHTTIGMDASKKAADMAQKAARRIAGTQSRATQSETERALEGQTGGNVPFGDTSHSNAPFIAEGFPPGDIQFIAGNIFDMPIASACADIVSVLFAPVPYEEARRVLRPGGLLLVCSAGREHLIELRRAIYDEVRYKDTPNVAPEGFTLAARDNATYSVTLDSAALGELFAMTPFCRRVGEAARQRLAQGGEESPMTVSVDIAVFRKV